MMFHRLAEDSLQSEHGFTERSWGKYVVLECVHDKNNVVHRQKLLLVNPNMSLQLHKHLGYAELWIGESEFDYTLEQENGELLTKTALPFERVFVPTNRKHAIINTSPQELRIFELQVGVICDDDNIKFD